MKNVFFSPKIKNVNKQHNIKKQIKVFNQLKAFYLKFFFYFFYKSYSLRNFLNLIKLKKIIYFPLLIYLLLEKNLYFGLEFEFSRVTNEFKLFFLFLSISNFLYFFIKRLKKRFGTKNYKNLKKHQMCHKKITMNSKNVK